MKAYFERLHLGEQARRLRRQLGLAGVVALALLSMTALFNKIALEPMQERARALASGVQRHAGRADPAAATGSASKLATFYAHLGRGETTTDWLAKLYAIGKATGVEMQSGTYKTQPATANAQGATSARIERYEIVVPVSGSYSQMRDFMKRALVEIPVLSIDQLALKRETRNDGAVQAELKMTLHTVKQ